MKKIGLKPKYNFSNWRSGDQKIYISDIRKAYEIYRWKPNYSPLSGINAMKDWIQKNV